jgi:uncharacterized membrane protein YdjX (TVP38/TMEM64 family)
MACKLRCTAFDKLMAKRRGSLLLLVLVLLAGILVPFFVWGDQIDAGAKEWMLACGDWAWLAGILLLIADVVLPIPSTVVMSVIGWLYGWFIGGLICVVGSMLSGVMAYGLCRWLGRGVAAWIAGEEGLMKAEALFAKHGGWLVSLSRWMPVLPEAVACLAGVARMRWRVFLPALVCGSVPLGFVFAAIGQLGQSEPWWAVVLSGITPVVLWLLAARLVRR